MSAAGNDKPPRPCTDYSIFFQLERAYILQVLLLKQPTHDGAIFHPSQPTYAGRPPLPRRYALLTLAYDWHLPGKGKRRKPRKHRKSHGAIGFHELSKRIVKAWKCVDEDVKRYCEQVCAVGMVGYKVMMKEWKRNKRFRRVALESHPPSQMIAEMVRSESLMIQAPEEINTTNTSIIQGEANNLKDILCTKEARDPSRSEETLLKALHEEVHVQDMTHCHDPMWRTEEEEALHKALCEEACVQDMAARCCHEAATPNSVLSNTRARSRSMEDSRYEPNPNEAPTQDDSSTQSVALVNLSNEEILDMWDAQESPLLRTLGPVAPAFCLDDAMKGEDIFTKKDAKGERAKIVHNSSSIDSNKPVDAEEIFGDLYCHECTPAISGGTANELSHHDNVDGKKSDIKGMSNLTIVSTNEPADNTDDKEMSKKRDSRNFDGHTNGQHCYECTPQELIYTDARHERYTKDEESCDGRADMAELEKIERWIGCETEYDRGNSLVQR